MKGLLEIILFEIRRKYYDDQPYLETMYITAFLMLYYGLMRVGEISDSPHTVKAVNVHKSNCRNKDNMLIILYSSKTHNLGSHPQIIKLIGQKTIEVTDSNKEITCYSTKSPKNLGNKQFCPVRWLKAYISLRPPIINNQENLFIFRDRNTLKPNHLRSLLRGIIKSLQLDETLYDTHSFRIGRATSLFKEKVPVDQIKELGRWKSNAVYKYLRNL